MLDAREKLLSLDKLVAGTRDTSYVWLANFDPKRRLNGTLYAFGLMHARE
jgi:hypothetical protein